MSPWQSVVLPLCPVVLLAVFTVSWGTFPGAAVGSYALSGHGVLWGIAAVELWLGRRRLEPIPRPVLLGAGLVLISTVLSPVSRAGWTALALAPSWWLAARWTARMWRRPSSRRVGARGLALLVTAVGVWSCVDFLAYERTRAAMPLGHHNLLAAWLLPLLPLTVTLWRGASKLDRILAVVAGCAGTAAMLASGSLAGWLCLVAVASLWPLQSAFRNRRAGAGLFRTGFFRARSRFWLCLGSVVAGLVALWFLQGSRVIAVLSGVDVSTSARLGYLHAAWAGFLERPVWGWGPGSTAWTASLHLEPVAEVNPPSQVVADFHNLPVQLLYELGLLGCLGLALIFASALRRPRRESQILSRAAGWGLIALGLFSFSGYLLSVPALPMASLWVWVLWRSESRLKIESPLVGRWPTGVAAILLVATIAWQIPRDLAHWLYDRAARAESGAAELLAQAQSLDPQYPLYGWRRAMLEADPDLALDSASRAPGLSVFWLTAGDLASDPRAATAAWRRAAALDPLGAAPAFRLGNADENRACRLPRAKLALMAEPLLVAGRWQDESVWTKAIAELGEQNDFDIYWRERLMDLASKRSNGGSTLAMGLKVDSEPSESLSLFAFRRAPWPSVVTRFELDAELVRQVDLLSIQSPPVSPAGLLPESCH